MSARPNKRHKSSDFVEEDYARGSIKQIYLKNFMTYKEAVTIPGPRLNMVLGPNGSGKSSVVCSICIGLNGKTALLGRASHLKEYVRKGEDTGVVRIHISGGPNKPDIVFERTMHAQDNKSTWRINGAVKTEKDVNAETQKLNIQLDNLCQFLPQEKVGEFAKMTPTELLTNTERAIGDAHLLRMHEKLIEGSGKLHKLEDDLGNATRQLKQLQEKKESMSRDVAKIQEQERLIQEAAKLRARCAWLRVKSEKMEMDACEEELRQVLDQQKKLQRSLDKKRGPLEEKKKMLGPLRAKIKEVGMQSEKRVKVLEDVMGGLDEDTENTFDSAHAKINDCEKDEADRQRKLSDARGLLAKTDDDIANYDKEPCPVSPEDERQLSAERSQLGVRMNELSGQRRDLLRRQDDLSQQLQAAEHQLMRLQQVSHQRMERLNNRFRGIANFKQKIDDMKRENRFQANVFGPIALEITMTVDTPQAVNALEMHIRRQLFSCFVTEHRGDQDLIQQVADEMRFNVNTVNYNQNPNAPLIHKHNPASHWNSFGVTHTLDEVFDAPMTVKHVLNDNSGITSTFLADGDDKVPRIIKETPIKIVYTDQTRSQGITSRYNKSDEARSTTTSLVRKAELLSGQVDQRQVEHHQAKVQDARAALDALKPQLQELDRQEAALRNEQKELESRHEAMKHAKQAHSKKIANLKVKRRTLVAKIGELEKKAPLAQKAAFTKQLAAVKKTFVATVTKLVQLNQDELQAQMELAVAHANENRCNEEISHMEQALQAERVELDNVTRTVAVKKQRADAARLRHDAARNLASTLLPATDKAGHAALAKLPDDPEECATQAGTLEDKAQAITVSDPGTVERYKALTNDIAERESRGAELTAKVHTYKAELEDARLKWLPELKEKVAAISTKFSENFKRIGSVGEVGLREDGENFANYAIEIRVKFRAEEDLEVLDAHRQSGGERSVSTIMYLLSLQNITQTPLRVVDEINQGMDTTNERRVFQAMVDAATERGTPQCLLMTPKLLPQLNYSAHVNVLQIYNGPLCSEPASQYTPDDVLSTLIGES